MKSAIIKSILLFLTVFTVIVVTFYMVTQRHDSEARRVTYSLYDQHGAQVTPQSFSGRYQLVFFGFTSCAHICPTQMHKLSRVMYQLESTGVHFRVVPTLISVDPERDSPKNMAIFLKNFHEGFVGLTGSRPALRRAADSFETLLPRLPQKLEQGYQISHSTVVYVVDPFSRIIEVLPFESSVDAMVHRIKSIVI